MSGDKIKSAPWDKPKGKGSARSGPPRPPGTPSNPGAPAPPPLRLSAEFRIDRSAPTTPPPVNKVERPATPRLAKPPPKSPEPPPKSPEPPPKSPEPPPKSPEPPPRSPKPPPTSPPLGMGGEPDPEDSSTFWSLEADGHDPRDQPDLDEPLSGTDDLFDPATGWEFAAVTDDSIPSIDSSLGGEPERPEPSAPIVEHTPTLLGRDPATAPLPELPDFTGDHWNLPPGPASAPKAIKPTAPQEATPSTSKLSKQPVPPRPAEDSGINFDPDGFLSIADTPAPVGGTTADELAPADWETDEFDLSVDESHPEIGDVLFSGAELPAISPELALLPTDEALSKAQELFGTGNPELGMALLESARIQAPDDTRLQTWLDYGERRVMLASCPGVKRDQVPTLVHSKSKLAAVTSGDQRSIVLAIDGRRTLVELREALPQIPVVGFWKELGKLQQRGWLRWTN